MWRKPVSRAVRGLRALDARLGRRDGRRRILVDARTRVNYTMVAPVHARMRHDPRVRFSFTASEEPHRLQEIYGDTPAAADTITPRRAALTRFDVYLASDFMWATLPRGALRVQMFHGVAGKYGFDAPDRSMRHWDRFFFVNRRRLRNFVECGAVPADSPALRLIGMPKVDCLVDGSLPRDAVLEAFGLDPARPTVLYAPTWSPASSLNAFGLDLIDRLARLPVNVIVKLHDRSRDPRARYSGGRDWPALVQAHLPPGRGLLATSADVCPYLAAADVMISDHSSAAFEYLLLDRPLVRVHLPELIASANVHADYVALLSEASLAIRSAEEATGAVERALADPQKRSVARRAVARELFHDPGGATKRCVEALYELLELSPQAHVGAATDLVTGDATCLS